MKLQTTHEHKMSSASCGIQETGADHAVLYIIKYNGLKTGSLEINKIERLCFNVVDFVSFGNPTR